MKSVVGGTARKTILNPWIIAGKGFESKAIRAPAIGLATPAIACG
jgi:hypothetical protein